METDVKRLKDFFFFFFLGGGGGGGGSSEFVNFKKNPYTMTKSMQKKHYVKNEFTSIFSALLPSKMQ